MKNLFILTGLAAGLLLAHQSRAQVSITEQQTTRTGRLTYLKIDTKKSPQPVSEAGSLLRNVLHLQAADEFRKAKTTVDTHGVTHERYQQYYNGVPVEYGTYLVHARNGLVETLNGEFKPVGALAAKPALSAQDALAKALSNVNASVYRWQLPAAERSVKALRNDPAATYYPQAVLLISEDDGTPAKPRLAYKFAIYAAKPASAQYVYVDALTGQVFRKTSVADTEEYTRNTSVPAKPAAPAASRPAGSLQTNAVGTAYTRYSGPQSITTSPVAGGWRLFEDNRMPGNGCGAGAVATIHTLNMQQQGDVGAAVDFVDNNNDWTYNEHHYTKDDAALDAHWGAEMTTDYFNRTFCYVSYDGSGAPLTGYVHTSLHDYNSTFYTNANALWDRALHIMVYGDGNTDYDPLTSLDIVAHEIGHGVAQSLVNFSNNMNDREAAALNEGLSDIWGACVEHYAAPGKLIWQHGEDVTLTTPYIRNLANPTANSHPDVYNGTNYDTQFGEPHINSTILSHWFYLLSQGGYGPNSAGTNFCVTGIGIDKAARIVFEAEQNYFYSTATYSAARQATLDATANMYGPNSLEYASVKYAWYAVGVGPNLGTPTITGPDQLCASSGNTTFTLVNGSNVTWTADPAGLFTVASGSGNQFITGAAAGQHGFGTITASVLGTCVATKTVQIGEQLTGYVNSFRTGYSSDLIPWQYGDNQVDGDYVGVRFPNPVGTTYTFTPDPSPHQYYIYGGYEVDIRFQTLYPGYYTFAFQATKTSSCGTVSDYYVIGYYYNGYTGRYDYTYSISPNPSSSEVVVTRTLPAAAAGRPAGSGAPGNQPGSSLASSLPEPLAVYLFNNYGQQVRTGQGDAHANTVTLDVRDLPGGLYNLRIGQGKDAVYKHLEISH